MQEQVIVTGMILNQTPIGEYDRRICLLTKERGRICAFAKGARKQNSRLLAATNLFAFGRFRLYEGRNSYTVSEAEIINYFEELRTDYISAYYGMYFLEIAEYYTRENNDEREMLKLVYQSLRALLHESFPNELVRAVYELKAIAVNGEFPGIPDTVKLEESSIYALEYIRTASVERLYTFSVTDSVLKQLQEVALLYRRRFMDRKFKSLEILETLC